MDKKLFGQSLIHCSGIITGGGFETPAEALHLGKKILAIPIRGQYEQLCNAAALKEMGVLCLKNTEDDFKNHFYSWILSDHTEQIDYSKSIPLCLEYLFSNKEAVETEEAF